MQTISRAKFLEMKERAEEAERAAGNNLRALQDEQAKHRRTSEQLAEATVHSKQGLAYLGEVTFLRQFVRDLTLTTLQPKPDGRDGYLRHD